MIVDNIKLIPGWTRFIEQNRSFFESFIEDAVKGSNTHFQKSILNMRFQMPPEFVWSK